MDNFEEDNSNFLEYDGNPMVFGDSLDDTGCVSCRLGMTGDCNFVSRQ